MVATFMGVESVLNNIGAVDFPSSIFLLALAVSVTTSTSVRAGGNYKKGLKETQGLKSGKNRDKRLRD
jgi:hypothetical protein